MGEWLEDEGFARYDVTLSPGTPESSLRLLNRRLVVETEEMAYTKVVQDKSNM